MRKNLNWQAYSNQDRHGILAKIKDVIASNDGYILNFNMFSDLAMTLSLEIEERHVIDLYNSLCDICGMSDLDTKEISQDSKKERVVIMNISFGKGKGKLKINVPEVPG